MAIIKDEVKLLFWLKNIHALALGTGWVKPNHVAKSFIVRLFNLSSHV
jgi:hypothetical protein